MTDAMKFYAMHRLQMLDYNVPGGKLNRGMAVYDVLAAIKGDKASLMLMFVMAVINLSVYQSKNQVQA